MSTLRGTERPPAARVYLVASATPIRTVADMSLNDRERSAGFRKRLASVPASTRDRIPISDTAAYPSSMKSPNTLHSLSSMTGGDASLSPRRFSIRTGAAPTALPGGPAGAVPLSIRARLTRVASFCGTRVGCQNFFSLLDVLDAVESVIASGGRLRVDDSLRIEPA